MRPVQQPGQLYLPVTDGHGWRFTPSGTVRVTAGHRHTGVARSPGRRGGRAPPGRRHDHEGFGSYVTRIPRDHGGWTGRQFLGPGFCYAGKCWTVIAKAVTAVAVTSRLHRPGRLQLRVA